MTNGNDCVEGLASGRRRRLTKRELFAAMAMQGLISNPDWSEVVMKQHGIFNKETCAKEMTAHGAVAFADSLIVALNEPMCPQCKLPNADNHYDAEHDICSIYERAMSEREVSK